MTPEILRPRRAPRQAHLAAALALAAAVAVLAGCGAKSGEGATQTAAKVNKEEITVLRVNYYLQQQRNLRPDQVDAASHQVLDHLVDQVLTVQKAYDLKLDRDPRVAQQIDEAKRAILDRAYLERVGEAAPRPTANEVKKYYDAKPALFAERRIYTLQELAITAPAEQYAEIKDRLSKTTNFEDFLTYLKTASIKFSGGQAVHPAEELPIDSLDAFAHLKDGETAITATPTGARVMRLAASRSQPVTLEQAQPAIEQFLLNERRRKLVSDELHSLHQAATIEYVGKFAHAASAPGAASAPAAAPSAADAQAAAIRNGLGLKP